MLQEANETIISKFKSKQSIVINANIINGKEVYDIITNNTIADPLKNDMRVNIISLSQDYVSEKNLFKVLSRNTLNILLTGKEQLIMKKAKELGYFDIPRKITSDELAKELNTTKANVSMTLRNIFKKVSTLIAL
ncbi:MAG: helix-turn-helix domain-containing protein [Saccharolobus sp.]